MLNIVCTYWTNPCTIDLTRLYSEARAPPVLCECMGSRMTSHDWYLLSFFLELVAQRTSIDPRHYIKSMKSLPLIYIWPSATDSSFQYFIFSLISALCVVTAWGQVNGGRLCEVPATVLGEFNYLYPIFHFSFLYSAWPPYAPVLICPSAIVHLLSGNMWGCATKRQTPSVG